MEVRGEGKVKGGRGRQQQGRTIATVPFLLQSSNNKKELKKHDNQPPKWRQWGKLVAEKLCRCFEADGHGLGTR
jgi:hypothetical protein